MPKPFESVSGSYEGDATGFTITLGFKPKLIVAFNETDGDVVWIAMDGLTDDKVIYISDKVYLLAANGITLSSTGFVVGSDDVVCENGDTYKYFAIGGN